VSKVKVRVQFTVEVDPDAWIDNYGIDPREVNADVKAYAEATVRDQLERVGVLAA